MIDGVVLATSFVVMYSLAYVFTAVLMKKPILAYPFGVDSHPVFDRVLMYGIAVALAISVYMRIEWAMFVMAVFESFGFTACWWEKIVWNVPDAPNAVLQSSMAWGDAVCAVALFYLVLV